MPKYKPLPYASEEGATLDLGSSLGQAAQSLDVAAQRAEAVGDVEGLLQVAAMWINLSDRLGSAPDEDEEEVGPLDDGESRTLGFSPRDISAVPLGGVIDDEPDED